jgi:heat shock protein HtpX
MNTLKTGLLMTAIFAILLLVGAQFGPGGIGIAFLVALTINGISYWYSDKIILTMYGAKEVGPNDAPRLYRIVKELTERAKLPMPRVCVMDNDSPNAFATGRNPDHAAVAATTGVLRLLNDEELAGVIGHELAHVGNRDILIQTIVASVAGAIMMLAYLLRYTAIFAGHGGRGSRRGNPLGLLALSILAPFAAVVVQMMISRTREYSADRDGARIAGDPLQLANALRKLKFGTERIPMEAGPATSHLFIVHPFSARGIARLFSTHPAIEDRIARLEEMARSGGTH